MFKEFLKLLQPRWYICTPYDWHEGTGLRIKVRAWSANSARMKAYDLLQCENIVVREYE